jgi:antitoxin HicB
MDADKTGSSDTVPAVINARGIMRSFVYPAKLTREKKGGFKVQFPDLPEAITSGKNRADALLQAADCLEEAVAGRIANGLDLPAPSRTGKRQVQVALPATMAAKAALYLAIQEAVGSPACD